METFKSGSLLKGMLIYGIGTFGTKILIFFMVPIYTYYISPSDMGIYDVLLSTINLLIPIVTLQISDAAYRWMIIDDKESTKYIRSTLQILILNCFLAFILILLVNYIHTFQYCIYFALLLISARSLETVQKLLRGLKNQKLYAISGILYTFIFLILNISQICYLKLGISSFFISSIVANLITLFMIFFIEPRLRINPLQKINQTTIKEMLKFSIPLVVNQLNWWIMSSSDRYIVMAFLGSAATGILSVTNKFPSMLQVIVNLFNISWQDMAISSQEKDTGQYYTKIFHKYYKIVFSLLFFLIPFTNLFIKLVMNIDYKQSANYVSFYYLGTVFQAFSAFYGVGYLKNKQTNKAFSTSVYGAILNAVINLIFIEYIGLHAAAISTFLAFFFMWILRERQNRECLGIEINKKYFSFLFSICLILAVLIIYTNNLLNIILSIIGLIAFILINRQDIITLLKKIISYLKIS